MTIGFPLPLTRDRDKEKGLLLFAAFSAALFGCDGFLIGFHLFLDFFFALGADFGAFFALFLDEFFAAQQLDEAGCSAITLAEAFVDDAQIAATAVAKTRGHRIKQ